MTEDMLAPKVWTIELGGNFTLPSGGTGPAVVIPEPGGGSIRLKNKRRIRWNNESGRVVRLEFKEWPDEADNDPDPVWPFNIYAGGQSVAPQTGSVTIPVGGSFEGKVAGTGRILVKYTVSVLTGDVVDGSVLPLDPMIVIER
jgi:hypothetical protein